MKRIGVLLLSTAILLSFAGCDEEDIGAGIGHIVTGVGKIFGFKSDEEIMDESIEKLINAICSKDRSALKSLLSQKALNEADNLDDKITMSFDLLQGEIVSCASGNDLGMSGYYEDGKGKKVLQSTFNVETTDGKYHIAILQTIRNDWNPDEVGIYAIWIVETPEFCETVSDWWMKDGEWVPGVAIGELHKLS